jgi:hypothetical protein
MFLNSNKWFVAIVLFAFVGSGCDKTNSSSDSSPARVAVAAVSKANSGGIAGFFKKKVVDPTYVIFVTDGDNDDHSATEAIIRQAASLPIFWQFVGIGGASFNFLKKLDDLSGRVVDNADFFQFPNGRPATDAELFGALLNEFPAWIKAAKKAGIL